MLLEKRLLEGELSGEVAAELRSLLGYARDLEQQVEDLDLLHATTVEASTALENELSVRNELVTGFLANTSHEIRTPLNGIIGQAELLIEEMRDDGLDRYERDLERIIGAGRHLVSLINDILDLSKVEAGRLELRTERVDLHGLVHDVLEGCSPLADRNEVRLWSDLDPALEIEGDPLRIRQCLLNLVSNACKFTRGGEVKVRAWLEGDLVGGQVFVSVADTGIGIRPEQLTSVFEPYRQAHVRTGPDVGGTGLGLAYTKTLARRMGGDVKVVSEYGRGSTFTLRLPAKAPPDARRTPLPP
ncbi:MAG: HAMP domain-containing histidine kinase [Alphaproteobacteria bacterium]|nr:HAMP domain-containing histidine kinase [Alphaproteobacteria bacterium]